MKEIAKDANQEHLNLPAEVGRDRPIWVVPFRNGNGTPAYFSRIAIARQFVNAQIAAPELGAEWQLRRGLWNAKQFLAGRGVRGFQYSEAFLEWLWKPIRPQIKDSIILSWFQLCPPSIIHDQGIEKWLCIDQTLRQLFDSPDYTTGISASSKKKAIELESIGYAAAAGIICQSGWAAKSLALDYNVDASRIHIMISGANLDGAEYARWESSTSASVEQRLERLQSLSPRLVFVGKDWRRKGLQKLIEALEVGRRLGLHAHLTVVGVDPQSIPLALRRAEGVEWAGFVPKKKNSQRFFDLIGSCDIGCLLSSSEAGGMALREYHALGLAVLATSVGGMPEYVIPDAARLLPPSATPETIASILLDTCLSDADIVRRAWQLRHTALWSEAFNVFPEFWPHRVAQPNPAKQNGTRQNRAAPSKPKVLLAAVGDCRDSSTWSGIPYHFLREAQKANLIDDSIPVKKLGNQWQLKRALWNTKRFLLAGSIGGYQYSNAFLEWFWESAKPITKGAVIINCFQLYPASIANDETIAKWFFIDQTLTQLLLTDSYNLRLSKDAISSAIAFEEKGYQSACGFVVHSQWAANSLLRDYHVPSEKVHVVVPGANIEPDAYNNWERSSGQIAEERMSHLANGTPRLVFVGKDWRRKGLEIAIRTLAEARGLGLNPSLRVIGCQADQIPASLRKEPNVEWIGFVNKRTDTSKFLSLIGECHIGCLFSTAEAGGISLREFHALGLPVIAADVGGIPEHVISKASVLVPRNSTPRQVAEKLASICSTDPDIARRAWRTRHTALWSESISKMQQLWEPTNQAQIAWNKQRQSDGSAAALKHTATF